MGTRDITARLKFHKGLFLRSAGFGLALASIGGALAVGSTLRAPSRALPQPAAATLEQDKDQTRVDHRRVALGAPSRDAQPSWTAANVSIWHPGKMEEAPVGESEFLSGPGAASEPSQEEWRQQDIASVSVVDGRTVRSGGVTIRLTGLELPPPDQVCRTLDNRLEQCVVRAATQLELLTRSRTLACRYRMVTSSEAGGSCRIGSHDLAERMVRSNYVRAADAGRTVMATMRASVAASH
jgi:hypothetical protein